MKSVPLAIMCVVIRTAVDPSLNNIIFRIDSTGVERFSLGGVFSILKLPFDPIGWSQYLVDVNWVAVAVALHIIMKTLRF